MSAALFEVDSFGYEDAWRVGSEAIARCRQERLPITLAIWLGEQRVFHAALEGSSANNDAWVERKANTARQFRRPSSEVQADFGELGIDFFPMFGLDPAKYTPSGGAIPVFVRGSLIGIIAVSGLVSGPISDHDVATSALNVLRS